MIVVLAASHLRRPEVMESVPRAETLSQREFEELLQDLIAIQDALFFADTQLLGPTQRTIHRDAREAANEALKQVRSVKFPFLRAATRAALLQAAPEVSALRAQLERASRAAEAMRVARKGLVILRKCAELMAPEGRNPEP